MKWDRVRDRFHYTLDPFQTEKDREAERDRQTDRECQRQ